MSPSHPPDVCPNCGAEVPPNAHACPECGADENTGWSNDAAFGSADLPDDEFDYDEFVQREFGTGRNPKPRGLPWFWWLIGVVVFVIVTLSLLLGLLGPG